MSTGTAVGYFLLFCSALYAVDNLLTLNPLKWLMAIVATPFSVGFSLIVLALSGAPQPTDEQIQWAVDGTLTFALLVFAGRAYQWFNQAARA
jgi:hypothetical protein